MKYTKMQNGAEKKQLLYLDFHNFFKTNDSFLNIKNLQI